MSSSNGSAPPVHKPKPVLHGQHVELAKRLIGSIVASPTLLYLDDNVARVTQAHMPDKALRDAWQAIQRTLADVGASEQLAASQIIVNTVGDITIDTLYECIIAGGATREVELAGSTALAIIEAAQKADRIRQLQEAQDALNTGENLAVVDEKLLAGATLEYGATIDHNIADAIDRVFESEPITGQSTGIDWLDKVTGGILPHEFWLIGGRYKGGKTRTARHILLHTLLNERPCSFFAIEGTWIPFGLDMVALLATKYLLNTGEGQQAMLSGRLFQRLGRNWVDKLSPIQRDAVQRARKTLHKWQDDGLLRVYSKERDHGAIQTIHDIRRHLRLDTAQASETVTGFVDFAQRIDGGETLFDSMREVALISQDTVQELDVSLYLLVQRNEMRNNEAGDEDWNAGAGIKGGGDLPAAADAFISTQYDIDSFNDAKEQNRPNAEMVIKLFFSRFEAADQQRLMVNRTSGYILGNVDRKVSLDDL